MRVRRTPSSLSIRWMRSLVSILGAFQVLMAVGAGSGLVRAAGAVGGLALAAAPWVPAHRRGIGVLLLVVGTLPIAALTVTSIIGPALAIVAWILMALIHSDRSRARPEARSVDLRTPHPAGPVAT